MPTHQMQTGFAHVGEARLYYEVAGKGQPFVMIHAGVADSRQWSNEFTYFAERFRVLRYDRRGFGKSEPVEGEFSDIADFAALLEQLGIREPLVLMGCSMGGGLAMDFALAHPARVNALIMVGSAPSGLELDVAEPARFAEAEKAYHAGDLDTLAELETQIWFDGEGRLPGQVNRAMRSLAYEMDRLALAHGALRLGTRLPDSQSPAIEHLAELDIPVLVITGAHDIPYMLAAADVMVARIPSARKAMIQDAAHLPNMDQPLEFRQLIEDFLEGVVPS